MKKNYYSSRPIFSTNFYYDIVIIKTFKKISSTNYYYDIVIIIVFKENFVSSKVDHSFYMIKTT